MWYCVITIFPEMIAALTTQGIVSRAVSTGLAKIICVNPRDFTTDNYRRIDDRPFGGGPGMVMMAQPLAKSVVHAKQLAAADGIDSVLVVYLSPQGKLFNEAAVSGIMAHKAIIFICGRYEGVDQRFIQRYVDEEWSIGDYVLTGGELPAMVIMDSLIRRIPGAMADYQSAVQDSFVDGLLDCPQYTKPDVFEGMAVPPVLKSGHHRKIEKWRFTSRYATTKARRPELAAQYCLTNEQVTWLNEQETQQ